MISQILVFVLMAISGYVSAKQIGAQGIWSPIAWYWIVLTLKNAVDLFSRKKEEKHGIGLRLCDRIGGSPCQDCVNRRPDCHGDCAAYTAYTRRIVEERDQRRAAVEREKEYEDFKQDSLRRERRRSK